MIYGLFASLLMGALQMERKIKNRSKSAKALQSPLYRQQVREKKRPYYDAKEVMDNDFSHEGLPPVGYYIEEVKDD